MSWWEYRRSNVFRCSGSLKLAEVAFRTVQMCSGFGSGQVCSNGVQVHTNHGCGSFVLLHESFFLGGVGQSFRQGGRVNLLCCTGFAT